MWLLHSKSVVTWRFGFEQPHITTRIGFVATARKSCVSYTIELCCILMYGLPISTDPCASWVLDSVFAVRDTICQNIYGKAYNHFWFTGSVLAQYVSYQEFLTIVVQYQYRLRHLWIPAGCRLRSVNWCQPASSDVTVHICTTTKDVVATAV